MVDTSLEHKLHILNGVLKDIITKPCIIFFSTIAEECKEKTKLDAFKHVHHLRIFQDYLKSEAPFFCCKKEILEQYITNIKTHEKFFDIFQVFVYIYYKFYAKKYIDNAKILSKDQIFIDLFLREIFTECARKLFVSPSVIIHNSIQLNQLCHDSIDLIIKKKLVLDILIKKEQRDAQTTIVSPSDTKIKKKKVIIL